MFTVKQVSLLSGVSVRTLHYYDEIGLLKPTQITQAGYRLYDDTSIRRLQQILLFRELEFPLKEIKQILDNPNLNPQRVLEDQIKLLEMQQKHIADLILFARRLQKEGVTQMSFEVFDKREQQQYQNEVKARFGNTDAYKEYRQRKPSDNAADGLMALFAELGTLRHLPAEDAAVQQKVAAIREYITANFYTCTKEIFASLGQMYTADERFRRNIDVAGGEGTAVFASKAIEIFCGK